FKAGRPAEAVRALTTALEELSLSAEPRLDAALVHYDRGLALQDLGKHEEALSDFAASREKGLHPPDRALAGWCFSALALGRFSEVVEAALHWTGMEHGRHAIVIIRTRDGKKFEEETWFARMDRAELSAKFNELVEPQFGAVRTAQLQKSLLELESVRNIKAVMQQLRQ
ncbi:MAG: hypothetical protein EBT83_13665, partial [Betaproteobacteria bacterium]|nr:hypothetical protein [Betaproteobacteria bacterium]